MPQLVALMDDILFLSRIREAARGSGVAVRSVRDKVELLAAAREDTRLVVVDADSVRVPWPEALAALRAEPSLGEIPIVAFVSHVRPDLALRARESGAARVLARSAFVRELPELVAALQKPPVEQPRR
jgi:CheY-like chemotaxis protein